MRATILSNMVLAGILLAYAGAAASGQPPYPMGTAFTYQGQLTDNGEPANDDYDFRFLLCDDPAAACTLATTTVEDCQVDDGLFTVEIDFGANVFNGQARWLEMGVRPGASTGAYETLTPRVELTPAPHALALPGLYTQQNATSPNLIGGYGGNTAIPGVVGATIAGGGSADYANHVTDDYGTVGGGQGNTAGSVDGNTTSDVGATVAGGIYNTATGALATVPGGAFNSATGAWSFAAGYAALADHDGTFVWADVRGPYPIPFASTGANQFLIRASGGVGIGTADPSNELSVNGDADFSGNVGIGTGSPTHPLHIKGDWAFLALDTNEVDQDAGVRLRENGAIKWHLYNDGDSEDLLRIGSPGGGGINITQNGSVGIGTPTPSTKLDVAGTTRTDILEIDGGMDLAEPFAVATAGEGGRPVKPGMVVAIDPEHPGKLKLATSSYDPKVAGIISGANGLKPGMVMRADGHKHAAGDFNVALTGRVWCRCDASYAPIRPGDRLTTSHTAGHAMKVTDNGRAIGAVIGKAMTDLAEGKGLVLVQPQ